MSKLLSKNNLIIALILATLFTFDISTNVFAEPEIEEPVYSEAEEHLMRIIDKQQALVLTQQEDLERYDNLDSEVSSAISTDLSDISTRILEAEGKFTGINNDNFDQVLTDIHSDLFQINNDLQDLSEEHQEIIKDDTSDQYLNQYIKAINSAIILYSNEDYTGLISNIDEVNELLDEIDDILNGLKEDPSSQSDWIRLEEATKDLQELTAENIEELKEE